MPDPQPAEGTATITCQSIELILTGKPDVKNKYGSGSIRPERVVFYYLNDRINAHLHGLWVGEDGELTDAPCDQLYRFDDTDWPDWLRDLAADRDPRPAPAKEIADAEEQQREPVSPAYARLQVAAKAAAEAAHLHAMHGMKRAFQLARRYGTTPIPPTEVLNALGLDENANTVEPTAPAPVPDPTWPRRAWDLGLLHKGGDPHHCPACLKQSDPPADFVCPGDNSEVLANPQPAEPPVHSGPGVNAATCPACTASPTPPQYPWMCPGPPATADESDGDRVVAYRSALPGALSIYCTNHTDELGDGATPLTSDDLPDGGTCVQCGADVLIPQPPKEA